MSKSPSTECEKTICKMFKGRKNDEEYHNCNKVYYYLDSTKTHPDGGWFTCRNGGAGNACRSKAIKKTGFSFGQVREKPGDEFYGNAEKPGILYNAFKDTFDRPFQNTPLSNDKRKYIFQKKKEGDKCGDKIVYLVPREMLNNFRVKEAIAQDDLKNQENLEAGDLVELIQTFKTNFLFKTIMSPGRTKDFLKKSWDLLSALSKITSLKKDWDLLSALSKITSHGNPFDSVKEDYFQKITRKHTTAEGYKIIKDSKTPEEPQEVSSNDRSRQMETYMGLFKGGGRTKRKRKKRRRKTRVKRKKTQKRKKAKRNYKKRRTKRRR